MYDAFILLKRNFFFAEQQLFSVQVKLAQWKELNSSLMN